VKTIIFNCIYRFYSHIGLEIRAKCFELASAVDSFGQCEFNHDPVISLIGYIIMMKLSI